MSEPEPWKCWPTAYGKDDMLRAAPIRVDNGPEFVSKELDLWAYMKGTTLDFSRPGTPTDNAFIESFNDNSAPSA